MKRVHVTLEKALLEQGDALEQVRDRVVEACDMHDVDERRLRRYGVLSGTVEQEERIVELRALDAVTSVEVDETRRAI